MRTDDPYGVIKKFTSSLWLAQTDFWHPHQGWTNQTPPFSGGGWIAGLEFDCIEKRGQIFGQRSEWINVITLIAKFCLQLWVFCENPAAPLREPGPNRTFTWRIFCVSPSSTIKTYRFEIQSNISLELTKLSIDQMPAPFMVNMFNPDLFHISITILCTMSTFSARMYAVYVLLVQKGLSSLGGGWGVKCLFMLFFKTKLLEKAFQRARQNGFPLCTILLLFFSWLSSCHVNVRSCVCVTVRRGSNILPGHLLIFSFLIVTLFRSRIPHRQSVGPVATSGTSKHKGKQPQR